MYFQFVLKPVWDSGKDSREKDLEQRYIGACTRIGSILYNHSQIRIVSLYSIYIYLAEPLQANWDPYRSNSSMPETTPVPWSCCWWSAVQTQKFFSVGGWGNVFYTFKWSVYSLHLPEGMPKKVQCSLTCSSWKSMQPSNWIIASSRGEREKIETIIQ